MRAETKAASKDDRDECDGRDETAEDEADELTLEVDACVARLDEGELPAATGDRTAPAAAAFAENDEGEPAALNVGVAPTAAVNDVEDDSRLALPKLGGAWPDGRRRRERSSWAEVEVEPVGGSVRWLWLLLLAPLLLLEPGALPSKRAPSSDDRRWSWTIIACLEESEKRTSGGGVDAGDGGLAREGGRDGGREREEGV